MIIIVMNSYTVVGSLLSVIPCSRSKNSRHKLAYHRCGKHHWANFGCRCGKFDFFCSFYMGHGDQILSMSL